MTISLGREGSYTIVDKKIAYDLHWAVYYVKANLVIIE